MNDPASTLTEKLAFVYPEAADGLRKRVEALIERYRDRVDRSERRLTHRDAVLITYGDAFQGDQAAPLEYLRRFAKNYLDEVVTAIHLLPCFPFSSDDGFSVKDYYAIDPRLGDWQDVERLGEQFDLMFDAVINHISKESIWFERFLKGDDAFQDYFVQADPHADYAQVVRPRALPLIHPYPHRDGTVHLWTTFSEDQIDLNFRSPQVFLQVLDVLLFYVARGARFVRFDAIAFIWKERGTTCIHLPQTHAIVQLYREIISRIAPSTVLITETNVPHKENVSYFGDGTSEAHMVYNFTLPPLLAYSIHKEDVTTLTSWAKSLVLPSADVCFFNFTASHDGVGLRPLDGIISREEIEEFAEIARSHGGFVSMKSNSDGTESPYEINCNYLDLLTDPHGPLELRTQRFLITQSVMLALPGVPGIYYHSLVGSENDREAALETGIKRRINRRKLGYDGLLSELDQHDSLRSRIYTAYRHLLQVRRSEPLFDPFGSATYHKHGSIFTVERERNGERLYAVHNFASSAASMQPLSRNCTDLLNGETLATDRWELAPFQFRWLKTKP